MDPQTQNAVAMALIGLAGTVFGLLASTIRDRDKLRFDSRLQALSLQNDVQAKQIADMTAAHAECEKKQSDHTTQIDRLTTAIINMGGGSSLHRPLPPEK